MENDPTGVRAASKGEDIVVRCACGLQYTLAEWAKLDFVGIQDDGVDTLLEIRNCTCGSTRARRCDTENALRLLNETAKRLRSALGRLRDIERTTSGLSVDIAELDRGAVRVVDVLRVGVRAVELERERCAAIVDQYSPQAQPHIDAMLKVISAKIRKPA